VAVVAVAVVEPQEIPEAQVVLAVQQTRLL
jgi:hypothetical protein